MSMTKNTNYKKAQSNNTMLSAYCINNPTGFSFNTLQYVKSDTYKNHHMNSQRALMKSLNSVTLSFS